MKFEDLKKRPGAHPVELNEEQLKQAAGGSNVGAIMILNDEQLEQATGGFYAGAMEWIEVDGVTYRGCMGCGEAWPAFNTPDPCPLCGFSWKKL